MLSSTCYFVRREQFRSSTDHVRVGYVCGMWLWFVVCVWDGMLVSMEVPATIHATRRGPAWHFIRSHSRRPDPCPPFNLKKLNFKHHQICDPRIKTTNLFAPTPSEYEAILYQLGRALHSGSIEKQIATHRNLTTTPESVNRGPRCPPLP